MNILTSIFYISTICDYMRLQALFLITPLLPRRANCVFENIQIAVVISAYCINTRVSLNDVSLKQRS